MSKREKDITARVKGKKTAASTFMGGMEETNKDSNVNINNDNKKENKEEPNKEIKDENNKENNEELDIETNNEVEEEIKVETYEDIRNKFIQKKKEKPKKRQQVVYLDENLSKDFDKWAKKHGKGAKSELIEVLLKNFLKENS